MRATGPRARQDQTIGVLGTAAGTPTRGWYGAEELRGTQPRASSICDNVLEIKSEAAVCKQ